jgi:hypothetical protein
MVIEVVDTATAAEFWEKLSPEKLLFPKPGELLYRGQADCGWHLTPSILRSANATRGPMQVFKEWAYIHQFVLHCDCIGLSIPNDSPAFREKFLSQNSRSGPGGPWRDWPPAEMYSLLALAQHYRLPTRLLDWSTRSYVAAYFAISDVLAGRVRPMPERLAVWVLNVEMKALFPKLKLVNVPGGNNANLAAQSGRFTLLQGNREPPYEEEPSLDLYLVGQPLAPPLKQVTLPVSEASAALELCRLYGVTGAIVFPDYYGAARGAEDQMNSEPRLP